MTQEQARLIWRDKEHYEGHLRVRILPFEWRDGCVQTEEEGALVNLWCMGPRLPHEIYVCTLLLDESGYSALNPPQFVEIIDDRFPELFDA